MVKSGMQAGAAVNYLRGLMDAATCSMGFDPTFSTPDELAAHMRAETDKWSKVVRQANLKIE
jgi:hypothetical protein